MSGNPIYQRLLVLTPHLDDTALLLHGLIHLPPLVHFIFHKEKTRGVRHTLQIIRQIGRRILKKVGILHHDQPALCKKRHRLRQIDQLCGINSLPFVISVIHRISVWDHSFRKPVLILLLQISFFPIQEIDPLKSSGFDIFIQAFHALPYHIPRNLFQ